MKKIYVLITTILITILLASCGNKIQDNEIHVGVAFYPMKDILQLIEEDLKEEGYKLVIHEFTNYQVPNELLANKELDANMIQHKYFLDSFNEANNTSLEIVFPIYHATFALYSKEYNDIDNIPNGTNITLPDDSTNLSRALYLLRQAGLLTFKNNKTTNLTTSDIETNEKNLTFNEKVPLTSLAQKYEETKFVVMYPTYALNLGLKGDQERLYVELLDEITKDYAISLASRSDNKNSDKINILIKYINSDKVRDFLIENYSWASSPAF